MATTYRADRHGHVTTEERPRYTPEPPKATGSSDGLVVALSPESVEELIGDKAETRVKLYTGQYL